MKIVGIPVGTTTPRADYAETNPKSAAFIKNKPDEAIQKAQQAADDAQTAADNAQTAADNAQDTADAALPKSGGNMTGDIAMGGKKVTGLADPTDDADAVHKKYVHDYVAGTKATATVTLTAAGWVENAQTVGAEGVTETNHVLITPAPESYVAYGESVVYCTGQGDGTLAFTCDEVPTVDLNVNVLIMN